MSHGTDDYNDDSVPTEEIYLELTELEAAADEYLATSAIEPSPVTTEDEPSGIKARIAHLRAKLNDRGASDDK